MGLDITIYEQEPVICPCCGTIVKYDSVDEVFSGGREWYEYLENIGYYIPYEKRTKDSEWYGKDMQLTGDQASELVGCATKHKVYNYDEIQQLVYNAKIEGHTVTINADW